jgi:hypothetical protein
VQQQIHLIDQTWIDAPVRTVSAVVADCANWRRWWPGLDLTVTRDRKDKGIQWAARSSPAAARCGGRLARRVGGRVAPRFGGRLAPLFGGRVAGRFGRPVVELAGTVEIWLEPHRDGVILHHFVRLDPTGDRLSDRVAAAHRRRLAWHAKQVFWQLKDELEAGRR